VPSARTPGRWPYRAAKPARARRVVRAQDTAPRGVQRRDLAPPPAFRLTPRQARFALLGLMVAGICSAAVWAYRSPYLTVHEVNVVGASQLSADEVRAAAGIDGASAFTVDLEAARARVAALPKVRSATIEKHGWTGATITIEERVAWGSWQVGDARVPIDADGYVLDGVAAAEDAPVIVEAEPEGAINAGDRMDPGAVQLAARLVDESRTAFGRDVLALIYRRTAGLTVVLSGEDVDGKPVWVTFGDSRDYEFKVATLYVLLERVREDDLALSAIDLRFGDRLSFN